MGAQDVVSTRIASISSNRTYTTGEAARICQLSQQTIIRCFDAGRLPGYRVPGSRFRRIPGAELIRFIEANAISTLQPLPPGSRQRRGRHGRILVVTSDHRTVDSVRSSIAEAVGSEGELRTARSAFEAGVTVGEFDPMAVILDIDTPNMDEAAVLEGLRSHPAKSGRRRVLIVGSDVQGDRESKLMALGASSVHCKPIDGEQLRRALDS